jgi:lipoprotein-releasing system permease protein
MSTTRALRIAVRHLTSHRGILAGGLACIAIAGAATAMILATTTGQRALLRRSLASVTSAVTLLPERVTPLVPRRLVEIDGAVIELVVNTPPHERREIKPRVEAATRARRSSRRIADVAPYVEVAGIYRNGARYRAVDIRGIDVAREERAGSLGSRMRRGSLAALRADPDGTIVSLGLARRLGLHRTGTVTLITSSGVIRRLRVAGIFRTGVAAVDDARVYLNLDLAQTLSGMARNASTGLELAVRGTDGLERVARAAEGATGYRAVTWEQREAPTLRAFRLRMFGAVTIVALGLVIAAFVVSLLLRVLVSAPSDDVLSPRIVLLEGAMLGVAGGVLGVAMGYAGSLALAGSRPRLLSFADAFVWYDRLPISLDASVLVIAFVACMLAGIGASIVPARRLRDLS